MTRSFRAAGLGLVAMMTFALVVLPARNLHSGDDQSGGKACPLEGAWRQVEQKNGDAQTYQKQPEGTEMFKFVTGGRFIWVVVRDGKIQSSLGGKYTVDKDKYTERIQYSSGEGQESFVGQSCDFTWKIDGNTWLHVGAIKVNNQDVKIDEKWERCK
jgi:hypothetical protein